MQISGTDRRRGSESGIGPAAVFSKFLPHAFAQKLSVPLPHRFVRIGKKEVIDHVASCPRSFEEEFGSNVRDIGNRVFLTGIRDSRCGAFEKLLHVDSEERERKESDV